VHHFNSGLSFEQDAGDVRNRAGPKGGKTEFARIGFYIGNQLGDRPDGDSGVHLQNFGRTSKPGDHRDVAYEIEIEIGVERRVDCIGRDGSKKRITVRRRASDFLRRDIGGSARPVLYYKWLAKPFRKPLTDEAR